MTSAADSQSVLAELEAADRLLVQQVFKPIANEYRISVPSPGSAEEGRPLLYVKQKKMKIKEDIRFRASPDAEEHLFMIKSKSVFEFRGRHEVLDADGKVIGLLEKAFGKSLLRSHWYARDPQGDVLLEAHESSWIIALVRRFADIGFDWAAILGWLPFNFVLRRGEAGDRDVQASPRQGPRPLRPRAHARGARHRPAPRGRFRGRARRVAGPLGLFVVYPRRDLLDLLRRAGKAARLRLVLRNSHAREE